MRTLGQILYKQESLELKHLHLLQRVNGDTEGSAQDRTVHILLEDQSVHILDREDRWSERGVEEAST